MRKIKIFGKSVPLWLFATVLVAIASVAIAGTLIGTVTMPWVVETPPPTASLSPSSVTLQIGSMYCGETKTQDPTDVLADLTVENGAVDITVELDGDYGGLDAVAVTVQLVQGTEVKYSAVIEPTIVVSSVLYPSPTGAGGWSDKTAGIVETCFVRVLAGEGDLAQLVKWVPGATITVDGTTYNYPNTPFGYTYDDTIPETGYIFVNDNDGGEQIQLVLVYPSTSAIIQDVAPGTYDVYVGFTVTAGNTPGSGAATLEFSYQ